MIFFFLNITVKFLNYAAIRPIFFTNSNQIMRIKYLIFCEVKMLFPNVITCVYTIKHHILQILLILFRFGHTVISNFVKQSKSFLHVNVRSFVISLYIPLIDVK